MRTELSFTVNFKRIPILTQRKTIHNYHHVVSKNKEKLTFKSKRKKGENKPCYDKKVSELVNLLKIHFYSPPHYP